jgi:hypothetical protein
MRVLIIGNLAGQLSAATKIRQWPPRLGVGIRFECCDDAELLAYGHQLARAVVGRGMFELEFIFDARHRERVAIDLNPRGFGQMRLDIARGNDLPRLWYELVTGGRAAPSPPPRADVVWRHGVPELVARATRLALGPARHETLRDSVADATQPTVDIINDWADPLPSALHEGQQQGPQLRIQAALVSSLTAEAIEAMAAPLGWQLDPSRSLLRRGPWQVELGWGQFAAILNRADLVLASAGTASEQAVGLGKPVLQLCGRGPQFTAKFAEAQRRLLGPGVSCATGKPGSAGARQATADLAAEQLAALADPEAGPRWRRQLAALGAERIGAAGGSVQIATAIMERIPATSGQNHG